MRIIGFLALLLLAGCGNLQQAQQVTLVVFQTACATTAFLNVAFQQAATGPFKDKISQTDIAQEQKWMGIVNAVCAQAPQDITTAYNLLIAAQQAFVSYQTGSAVPPSPPNVPAGVLPSS